MILSSLYDPFEHGRFDCDCQPTPREGDNEHNIDDKYQADRQRYEPYEGGEASPEFRSKIGTQKNFSSSSDECWPASSSGPSTKASTMQGSDILSTVKEENTYKSAFSTHHSAPTVARRGNGRTHYNSHVNEVIKEEEELTKEYIPNRAYDQDYHQDEDYPTLELNQSHSDLSSITETCYTKNRDQIRDTILLEILRGNIPDFLDKTKIEKIVRGEELSYSQSRSERNSMTIIQNDYTETKAPNLDYNESKDYDEAYAKEVARKEKFNNFKKSERSSTNKSRSSNSSKSRSSQRIEKSRSGDNETASISAESQGNMSKKSSQSRLFGKFSRSSRSSKSSKSGNSTNQKSLSNAKPPQAKRTFRTTPDHSLSYDKGSFDECEKGITYKSAQNWTNIAVFAASSVLDAGGSQEAAEAATTAILRVGSKMGNSHQNGLAVAAEASTAVLATNSGQSAAAAAAVAVLKACGTDVPESLFDEASGKSQRSGSRTSQNIDKAHLKQSHDYDTYDIVNKENLRVNNRASEYISYEPKASGKQHKRDRSTHSNQSILTSSNGNRNEYTPQENQKIGVQMSSSKTMDKSSQSSSGRSRNSQGSSVSGDLTSYFEKSNIGKSMIQLKDSDLFSLKSSDIINHVSELTKYVSSLMSPSEKKKQRPKTEVDVEADHYIHYGDSGTISSPANKSGQYSLGGDSGTIKDRNAVVEKYGETETVKYEFELGDHLMRMEETSNEIELSILASRTKHLLNEIKNESPNDERKAVLYKTRKHLAKLVKNSKRENKELRTFSH